ncbi:MAG TPA: hypothetical protein VEG33_18315 [Streptosporangiaceae bacterium]|nr:hypothetical protein [Streptosporangiaceae bacterium]
MTDRGRPGMAGGCGKHRPPRLIRGVLAALAIAAAAALASCASAAPAPGQGTSSGPAPSAGAGQLPSCTAGQWSLTQAGPPEGDGPDFFIPFRGRYRSGPKCRLAATVRGELLGPGGVPIPHASAHGTIHAILGPAHARAQTPLFAFLWSNWCAHSSSVTARIQKPGQVLTITVQGRPMCISRQRPVGLQWHRM